MWTPKQSFERTCNYGVRMRWKLMVGGGVGSLEGYNCKEQKRNEKNL